MKSTIVAKIPFNFKGQVFEPSAKLDLDDWARRSQGELPEFAEVIARENEISAYSYELEVMEMSEVVFESPTGLAVAFFDPHDQTFDFDGFKKQWQQQQSFDALNQISQEYLGKDLEQGSDLHQALVAALMLGKER
ncbi:MAG: hypothetical protein R3219_04050 [Hydrogenovibrio sp.]|nr:hypothetical protein [Hydrogenovibrio sp.]